MKLRYVTILTAGLLLAADAPQSGLSLIHI